MKRYVVEPNTQVDLNDHDPKDTSNYKEKAEGLKRSEHLHQKLEKLQEALYAEGTRAILIILQGIDTAGKDGTIRHVMEGVNPQGCTVSSFKVPTPLERSHDFLWRIHAACPPSGVIGIFNRSHYEDVLITRVHSLITDAEADRRLHEIVEFEKTLTNRGVRILKFFLNISQDEQKARLLARLDDPDKRWKLSAQDLKERGYWNAYQKAFTQALSATSTKENPWIVVPSDHKWYRNVVVAETLVQALADMAPHAPNSHAGDWKKLRQDLKDS